MAGGIGVGDLVDRAALVPGRAAPVRADGAFLREAGIGGRVLSSGAGDVECLSGVTFESALIRTGDHVTEGFYVLLRLTSRVGVSVKENGRDQVALLRVTFEGQRSPSHS